MATRTGKASKKGRDTYMELIHKFPLRPIKGDEEHDQATAIIGDMINADLDSGASDYLDTLILLVNKYEDDHHSVSMHMAPREALQALMEANDLNQADIGKIIGSGSAVSMFLGGARELSKAQIKKLADRFKINAAIFID